MKTMTPEPSEQEMLVAALEKLGWEVHRAFDHIALVKQGVGACDGPEKWLPQIVELAHAPDLLHSLDAHFAPGGTVEWFKKRGIRLHLIIRPDGDSSCELWQGVEFDDFILVEEDKELPMAILKAFLKHGG